MDQVAARLLQAPAYQEASSRQSSTTPTASPPSDEERERGEDYQKQLKVETEAYHKLVRDGGRPPFPLDIFEGVIKDHERYPEHHDILSYWADCRNEATGVIRCFSGDLGHWEYFRILQQFAREHKFEDEWMLFTVAEWRKSFLFSLNSEMFPTRHPEKWHSQSESTWEEYYKRYNLSIDKPTDRFGFPEYTKALKKRLARHGMTRTFQLDDDPARQDGLTTWIEYVNYIARSYEMPAKFMKRRQKQYNKDWKKLVKSGVLRPDETTRDSLKDTQRALQDEHEQRSAEKAVESAKRDIMLAEMAISNSQRFDRSVENLQQALIKAQAQLETAITEHESIKRRCRLTLEFLVRTRGYSNAKCEAERLSILLRWTLQQVPLIGLESTPFGIAQISPSGDADGSRTGRLNYDRGEEQSEDQGCRKRTHDDGENDSTSDGKTRLLSTPQEKDRYKRRAYDTVHDERRSKRPRRTTAGASPGLGCSPASPTSLLRTSP
ncbi:hypothetical protein LTS18_007666 [Coniosporium uncinatum]|uniref:Uncharacterized protein n=1 Tax=Coniosporium uncinatum TaxID=93489 RepID=A0ACC3DCC9_9PEZI|nr:hypothetical protein LTS18_007666 [Coniosporium uncinatum]